MFTKILIANRGEIACRIIRTANKLGIRTVAVYSEVDAQAQHVLQADEAVAIGKAPATESYLNVAAIIAAAKKCGVDAIHPGYGFLSESAVLCQACNDNNIVFIGPTAEAIDAMGSKARAKQIMKDAGVPLIPGYQEDDQTPAILLKNANAIGFPVLVKASAGGGGKGMRLVEKESEFEAALQSAKREAKNAFNDDHVILEKYVEHARHVEVQIFCDELGNAVYIGDRDCSLQRRHQKIIEEAPAPGIKDEIRAAMGEAAVRAATAIHYRGAGTVEFLLDGEQFYFMEMNTRLQVEHPVTEMVTGLDLVEWQIRVAEGQALPLRQDDIVIKGHAIEARVYAEDCTNQFLPSSGEITFLNWPEKTEGYRIDSGIVVGDEVSNYYDPMLAKIIVKEENRKAALTQIQHALEKVKIWGLKTNVVFLSRLLTDSIFQQGKMHTAYIDQHVAELIQVADISDDVIALAVLTRFLMLQYKAVQADSVGQSPWDIKDAWRLNLPHSFSFNLGFQDNIYPINLTVISNQIEFNLNNKTYTASGMLEGNTIHGVLNGCKTTNTVLIEKEALLVFCGNQPFEFSLSANNYALADPAQQANGAVAPMHGRLTEVLVAIGDAVDEGQPLAVVEAMKMEHTLRAPKAGKVDEIFFQQNDVVDSGAVIIGLDN